MLEKLLLKAYDELISWYELFINEEEIFKIYECFNFKVDTIFEKKLYLIEIRKEFHYMILGKKEFCDYYANGNGIEKLIMDNLDEFKKKFDDDFSDYTGEVTFKSI